MIPDFGPRRWIFVFLNAAHIRAQILWSIPNVTFGLSGAYSSAYLLWALIRQGWKLLIDRDFERRMEKDFTVMIVSNEEVLRLLIPTWSPGSKICLSSMQPPMSLNS